MKAIIIDDEDKARRLLRILLEENCPEITEIAEAENVPEGVRNISEFNPDLVFLDIEMPGYLGIQLIDFFTPEQINFEIIFTTAYSDYAIKAFQLNAVDYLLKPLRAEQVTKAVEKAAEMRGNSQINERLKELKSTLEASKVRKIGLPVSNGILFVKFDNILYFEADRMYTNVMTTDQGALLISKPLKFFIEALTGISEFYKPHRSYLVNLKFLRQYVQQDGGYIIMDDQKTISLSKDKKEEFLQLMQNY